MLKRYRFWLITAIVFMTLSGLLHSVGLINDLQGQNETEIRLVELMTTYHLDMGAGLPTMNGLFLNHSVHVLHGSTCLALCFLFFLSPRTHHLTSCVELSVFNVIFFSIVFVIMAFLTFSISGAGIFVVS